MTVNEYLNQVNSLLEDFPATVNEILTDGKIKPSLMVKPRQRMRQTGPLPSVGDYKKQGKKRTNAATLRQSGAIKLYDKGDFNKGLFVELIGGKLQMDSEDKKRNLLVGKYGTDIFNLKSEEVNFILVNFIVPELKKLVEPREEIIIDIG